MANTEAQQSKRRQRKVPEQQQVITLLRRQLALGRKLLNSELTSSEWEVESRKVLGEMDQLRKRAG